MPECVWPLQAMLGEGPLWLDGRLWFTDIKQSRVHCFHADSGVGQSWNAPAPVGFLAPLPNGHFIITAEAARDVVAVLLYGITLGAMGFLWAAWQRRGAEKPKELPTSAYGRPLVKKA